MILYQVSHQKDVSQISTVIPTLSFTKNTLGDEINDFCVTNPMLSDLAEYLPQYKSKENSGLFRKPYDLIHFESFDSIDEWVVIYCIESFIFNTYTQKDINYVFDIADITDIEDVFNNEWITEAEIIVKPGQILMFRPWLFHSISGGIGHYFFMETINDNKI